MLAEKTAEVHEEQEDVLVLLATEDLNTVKARLVQHLRSLCAKTARQFKVEQVAAKEGAAVAKQVFIPAPAYMGLDEEERKILEKCRKEQEASKKKETAKAESSWKMLNAKKTPYGYGYNYGKFGGGYVGASGFGGGAGGLGAWALQQLLAQKTGQGSEDKKSGGGGQQRPAGPWVCRQDGGKQAAIPLQWVRGPRPLEARWGVQPQGRGGLHQEEDGGAVQEGHRGGRRQRVRNEIYLFRFFNKI